MVVKVTAVLGCLSLGQINPNFGLKLPKCVYCAALRAGTFSPVVEFVRCFASLCACFFSTCVDFRLSFGSLELPPLLHAHYQCHYLTTPL